MVSTEVVFYLLRKQSITKLILLAKEVEFLKTSHDDYKSFCVFCANNK